MCRNQPLTAVHSPADMLSMNIRWDTLHTGIKALHVHKGNKATHRAASGVSAPTTYCGIPTISGFVSAGAA